MLNKNSVYFGCIAALSINLMGCSPHKKENAMPALYETKAEAIKAASKFGCSGAHKMGEKWMPCEKHGGHLNHENEHRPGNHNNH